MDVYTVLGQVHTGTTALAKCLLQAGVDFGDNCNHAHEDNFLIKVYYEHFVRYGVFEASQNWDETSCKIRDAFIKNKKDTWGFKHPYTAICIDGWLEALPNLKMIATIRHPSNWILRMDGARAFSVYGLDRKPIYRGWEEAAGREWTWCYGPILRLHREKNIPLVFIDKPDAEYQIIRGFEEIGLTYNGGYEKKKLTHNQEYGWCPKSAEEIWNGLAGTYRPAH